MSFAALVWSLHKTCPSDSSIHCFTLLKTHISVGGRWGGTCKGDNFLNGEPQLKSMKWIGYSNFMLNLCIWQSLKQYQSWSEFYITHMIGVLVRLCFGITVCSKNWIVPQNKYVKYDTLPWETRISITKVSYRHYGSTLHICFTSCHIPGWHAYPQL